MNDVKTIVSILMGFVFGKFLRLTLMTSLKYERDFHINIDLLMNFSDFRCIIAS